MPKRLHRCYGAGYLQFTIPARVKEWRPGEMKVRSKGLISSVVRTLRKPAQGAAASFEKEEKG
jgi:hypothetical protein